MSEHVLTYLGAYHDGELSRAVRSDVEAHLAECTGCRAELESLRVLSSLLASSPAPVPVEPAQVYARRLVSELPARETRRIEAVLLAAWRLAPLGLFGTWAFFQAALFVAGGLTLSAGLLPGGERLLGTLAPSMSINGFPMFGALLPGSGVIALVEGLADLLPGLGAFIPLSSVSLVSSTLIGLLFLSWMAGQAAVRQRKANQVL